ncbi:MAG: hypothetical protein CVV64_07950 [Candidatus Wallbacteria bacterium HGW-Wallbacteria-1]|jgi:hypothetical protein|uniref:Penicillin-binding protein transpeptidase domain-containing protein n=1 Tax=Candidatus Wallbacteria bacterium HGW-Wallbacteria-1 TaxID=2013854 RepID=A0A2N1PRA5_9BACT|nr:MAG: hypothetical protein CVV64_07950 [Candidatus Wallbacteria bacterium HGW-Wallbacteria-1]
MNASSALFTGILISTVFCISLLTQLPVLALEAESVFVADISSGRIILAKDPVKILSKPADTGSLTKIFITYVMAADNLENVFFSCGPWTRNEKPCWNPSGHGIENSVQALSDSCNSFFRRAIADHNLRAKVMSLMKRLNAPPCSGHIEPALPGGDGEKVFLPSSIFWAIAAILNGGKIFSFPSGSRDMQALLLNSVAIIQKARRTVMTGMKMCSENGTASVVNSPDILSKTGTGLNRSRTGRLKIQGWFMGFWPAASPTHGILYTCSGLRGSQCAARAIAILRKKGWVR